MHVKRIAARKQGISHRVMRECREFDTRKLIQDYYPVLEGLQLQSSDSYDDTEMMTDAATPGDVQQANLVFADGSQPNIDDTSALDRFGPVVNVSQHTELGQFLSRPTLVDTRTWSTTDTIGPLPGNFIYIWHSLLSDVVIKRKIENYAFLKATLCIKMLINGTKFHYGSLRASYEPCAEAYPLRYNWHPVALGSNNAVRIAYDQTPGAYLDPSANMGAEIRVPMLYNREFVPLKFASDVQDLGKLRWVVFEPLRVANTGATTSLTVSTYAWLEDVSLSGSTNSLSLQAKDEYDEAGGPVSAPAMGVAKVARALSNVPIIGRFAKATEMGATAAGGIAKLFGFTDVPNIQDVPPMSLLTAPHLATSQISVPYQPLTLNPKSQITIDPTVHGLAPVDELAIQNIVSKKCFFASTVWTTSNTVGTQLFNCVVNPSVDWAGSISQGSPATVRGYAIQHTPLSFVSQFFEHWRGDLVFTIKLIKSKFHSGRLRVTWDPMSGNGNITPPANTVYNTIIDLSDRDEYEVRIPWFYQLNYARVRDVQDNVWTTGSALTVDPTFDNGVLNISVLTSLAAPLSSADVGILVYVHGAENFEVNNPTTLGVSSLFTLQSKDTVEVDFETPNAPTAAPTMKHYGAPIVSLRELARRSRLMDRVPCPPSTSTAGFRFVKSVQHLPVCSGYDPNGLSSANGIYQGGTYAYNFTGNNFIPMLISAYVGVFGSLNYTFVLDTGGSNHGQDIGVFRLNTTKNLPLAAGSIQGSLTSASTISAARRELTRFSEFDNGGVVMSTSVNNTLQVNMPYLNNYSFFSTDPARVLQNTQIARFDDGSGRISLNYSAWLKQFTSEDVSKRVTLATYVGVGPDFQVLQWVFPATAFVYTTVTAA
jgi:hypothetical protein